MSSKSALGLNAVPHSPESEDHWVPLSDLMTGLMMLFMLVAVLFMVKVSEQTKSQVHIVQQAAIEKVREADKVTNVVEDFDALLKKLHDDLQHEFEADLPKWGAELDRDLTVRFKEPDVLFGTGDARLKVRFVKILDDFFPRYIRILTGSDFRSSIEEVRIEGHTSSIWNNQIGGDQAYFRNMELSQQRTRSALEHVLTLASIFAEKKWLIGHLTANGLSSSKPRLNPNGTENASESQRVEFRVRMNTSQQLAQIRSQPSANRP